MPSSPGKRATEPGEDGAAAGGWPPAVLFAAVLIVAPLQLPGGTGRAAGIETGEGLRRDAVVLAVEKARPAVVNINAEEDTVRSNPFSGFGDPFFDRFFQDFFETRPRRRAPTRSLGSGVVIDPRGYILTNEHVVARTSSIRVTLADERSFPAKIVGSDPDHDLAVLKVDAPTDLPHTDIGSSGGALIGEKVIAIGNPFGLSHTVTTGVVSATRRSIRTSQGRVYYDFIQTDAAINPGNSGGPLLDITGRMIGINTAIYAEGYGIGFAIPSDVAARVVEDLVRYGEVHAVWLGIAVAEGDREGAPEPAVTVAGLLGGGPGEQAGLLPGDVILRVGGETVRSTGEYHFRVGNYGEGDLVPLQVRRGGREIDFIVRARRPDENTVRKVLWEWFGIGAERDGHGLKIARVRKGGAADGIGLVPGDRVLQIGGEEVREDDDLGDEILRAGRTGKLLMLIQRGHRGYYITLKAKK